MENIVAAWQEVVSEKKKLDPVDDKANDKHFTDRKDKDIDNDGDVDSSDEYLHKRRAATDDAIAGGKKPAKKMKEEKDSKVCPKCDGEGCEHCDGKGTHEAYESSCGGVTASKKYKKESVSHEVHGKGQILDESEEGFDVLFDHGVEFNVPAEQLEGVSSAIKTAKRMGGNMTGAVKKIDKAKKGMSDNPRVQKALKKANEEDELEEKLETQRSKLPNGQRPKGPGWVLKKSGEQSGKPHSEWERKTKTVESVQEGTVAEFEEEVVTKYGNFIDGTKAALAQMWEAAAQKQKQAEKQEISPSNKKMTDLVDLENPEMVADDAKGHEDATKAGRAGPGQAPKRGSENRNGDTKIVKPVTGAVMHTTGKE